MRIQAVRRGLTLIELVMVLVVLVVLATVAVPLVGGVREDAAATATRATFAAVRDAVMRYRADVGTYPVVLAGLVVKPASETREYDPFTRTGWNGPYLSRFPIDAWGKPLAIYRGTDEESGTVEWFWLQSWGPDGDHASAKVAVPGPRVGNGDDLLLVLSSRPVPQ